MAPDTRILPRVLVVDDDRLNREIARDALGASARVECCPSAEDALDALALLAEAEPTTRRMVEMRFFENMTGPAIGAAFGVTEGCVSKIIRGWLRGARSRMKGDE